MGYSVDELTREAGLSVDTVRYYQSIGLLPGPARQGRRAIYSDDHLDRLRLIRSMAARGLPLKVIGSLLDREGPAESDRALLAAIEEETPPGMLTSEELADRTGVPRTLLSSIEKAGLVEAEEEGGPRYSESDLGAAAGALKLLRYGFPVTKLIALAVRHDRAVRRTVDDAIDLFDDCVRKAARPESETDEVTSAFRDILPLVTMLVAHHFQRTLVARALSRLKKKGDRGELRVAVDVARRSRLELRWP